MPDVRIVPSSFSKEGNVVVFLEHLDGTPFSPDIDEIGLSGMSLPVEITSPDGRIYFIPPGDGDGTFSQVSLPSGDALALETDVAYVDDPLDCVQSLRAQMSVLRQLTQAQVAADRTGSMAEDLVAARYWALLSTGHLHFGDALEGIDNAAQTSDPDAVAVEMKALADEHAAELENFQAAAFPPS